MAIISGAANLVPDGYDGIFVHDRITGQTTRLPEGYDVPYDPEIYFFYPSLSEDGQYVAFQSNTANLVTGDTNGEPDIFVHDRQAGMTKRVSVAYDGAESNDSSHVGVISADGKHVSFHSYATNLVAGDTNDDLAVFVASKFK